MSSNFFVFRTIGGITSRPAAFLILIFVSPTSSSSVNNSRKMSKWPLKFFWYVYPSEEFPSRCLKWCFHIGIRSPCSANFNFVLVVFFISVVLIVIVYLLPSILFYCFSFVYILVSFLFFVFVFFTLGFLKFLCIGIVGFLLLTTNAIFHVFSFFPNCYCLRWNSSFGSWFGWNALGCCFCMGGNNVFTLIKRSMSFKCFLKGIKLIFSFTV